MKLLFIQGGSRVRVCKNGNKYVDGNFNNAIWNRYKSYCTELTVILRQIEKTFNEEELNNRFNVIDTGIMQLKLVDDIYSPKKNYFNLRLRRKIDRIIEEEVIKADKVIIRSVGNFYTNTALKYCKKYKKDYLIEVTGFAFEGLWYHSIIGKIVAIPREIKLRRSIKKAPFAVYVTNYSLQKRYPCLGKTLGCSDVELEKFSNDTIQRRLEKINNYDKKQELVLGTAAFLDVKWKGQQDVIRALYKIKKMSERKYIYELIGAGTGKRLKKLIKKYRLENEVKIIGVKKHEDVFKWLNEIDIYIQPSYQEGLCRAIVEAMSTSCPCLASNVGGNYELLNDKFIFKKGNINQIVDKIIKISDMKVLIQSSKDNYNNSRIYEKSILDKKRDAFYNSFVNTR